MSYYTNSFLNKIAEIISSGGDMIKLDKICGILKFITITNKDAISSLINDLDNNDIHFVIKSLKDSGVWDLDSDNFTQVFYT